MNEQTNKKPHLFEDESTTLSDTGLSYEEAMRELEEIVTTLEDGQAPLDRSLELVRRGRDLSLACTRMLDEAELTLSQLAATPEGELVEEPLDWDEASDGENG